MPGGVSTTVTPRAQPAAHGRVGVQAVVVADQNARDVGDRVHRDPINASDQVLLQHGQPLIDVEVRSQRMVVGQPIRAVGTDIEHGAQGQAQVVDGCDPGIRGVLGQLESAAVIRKRV